MGKTARKKKPAHGLDTTKQRSIIDTGSDKKVSPRLPGEKRNKRKVTSINKSSQQVVAPQVSKRACGLSGHPSSISTSLPPQRRKGHLSSAPGAGTCTEQPLERRNLGRNSQGSMSATTARSQLPRKMSLQVHKAAKIPKYPRMFDSSQEAKQFFRHLIHPVVPTKFFSEFWEKKPLLVKRHSLDYNDGWFSTGEFDRILRQNQLNYGENIDIESYVNGRRETHKPSGRAYAPVVWDSYQNGCSVRLRNPQTYSRSVWKLLSTLQEYFGCCASANIYLTPMGTQGFAPHWEDTDTFIIQLEGKNNWRLYDSRSEEEILPRFSSGNFSDKDIGAPIMDATVEAGDMLYFPRGTIHQGRTLSDSHSMHLTVSVCQSNTWADLLETLVPRAIQTAMEEDVEFRKSLPRDYLNYMGVAFSDQVWPERKSFLHHVEQLMIKMLSHAPVDTSCDQMGKQYIHTSLPPVLTEAEKKCSIHGNGEKWHQTEKRVVGAVELEPDTMVKIIRKGAIRMVNENGKVNIYHNLENHRVHKGQDVQYVEIKAGMTPAVEYLLFNYPNYTSIDSFPCETIDRKMEIASILYDKGILLTEVPMEAMSDSESDDDFSEEIVNSKKAETGKKSSR